MGSRSAIDAALDRLYPTEVDLRFSLQPGPDGAEPPLAEVVIYRAAKPVAHWHYVTYGLSELDEKNSPDPALSGFGVEYTLRLADASERPPSWPINLLRYLAQRTWETRQPYDPGHSMNLRPGMLDPVSPGVEALAFYEDEDLRAIDTPTGRVTFVDALPLMAGEYELIGSWDAFKVAAEVRALQGDLLWRVGRQSVLEGPRKDAIAAQVDREGSNQSVDFAELRCDANGILLDSVGILVLPKFLRHRLKHGRDAKVIGPEQTLELQPGSWAFSHGPVSKLEVPAAEAPALADELSKAPDHSTVTRPNGVRFLVDRTA